MAREVTKKFQEKLFFDNIDDARKYFLNHAPIGEFTVFVNFMSTNVDVLNEVCDIFKNYTELQSLKSKQVAQFIHEYCLSDSSVKDIYNAILKIKS